MISQTQQLTGVWGNIMPHQQIETGLRPAYAGETPALLSAMGLLWVVVTLQVRGFSPAATPVTENSVVLVPHQRQRDGAA